MDADSLKLLTPRARQVIVLAGGEMKRLGAPALSPEHLLLGIMNEGEGIGAGLLRSLSVSLVQVRAALVPAEAGQSCLFCGHSGSQVKRLFPPERGLGAATTPGALICDQCVEHFHSLLHLA